MQRSSGSKKMNNQWQFANYSWLGPRDPLAVLVFVEKHLKCGILLEQLLLRPILASLDPTDRRFSSAYPGFSRDFGLKGRRTWSFPANEGNEC